MEIIFATLRVSTPLLFASLGGLFGERSGIIQLNIEGNMMAGAFAGATVGILTGNPWLGFLAGGLAGTLMSLLYGIFVIHFRADQVVSGMAMNLLAIGTIPLMMKPLFGSTGNTPSFTGVVNWDFFPTALILTLALLLVALWSRSRSLLLLSFAGDKPDALPVAGISVNRVRWISLAVAGLLAGFGGAVLSIFLASAYSRNMVAGRGFMALAALILGRWKPGPTALACLGFGLLEASQLRLQADLLAVAPWLNQQLLMVLPYLITLVVLGGFLGVSRPPLALGK
jgi:general nucleoside transport system permease protein